MSPSVLSQSTERKRRCTITVEGVVQGVGFRPFVYRLARRHGLLGSVRNGLGGVLIEAEGDEGELVRFLDEVIFRAPPVAHPRRLSVAWSAPRFDTAAFRIAPSSHQGTPALFPAPD